MNNIKLVPVDSSILHRHMKLESVIIGGSMNNIKLVPVDSSVLDRHKKLEPVIIIPQTRTLGINPLAMKSVMFGNIHTHKPKTSFGLRAKPQKLCQICYKRNASVVLDAQQYKDYYGRVMLEIIEVCELCKGRVENGDLI